MIGEPFTTVIPCVPPIATLHTVPDLAAFISAPVLVINVPFNDNSSVSRIPLISALPSTSSEAASNSPVRVIFLKPVISLFVSTITALLLATIPSVIVCN